MSPLLEMRLMLYAYYCFAILLMIVVTALTTLGVLKQYFPQHYRTALIFLRKFSKQGRWLRHGRFDKLISYYEVRAEKKKKLRYFYLGIARLYAYEYDEAIFYFEKYLPLAIGHRQIINTQCYQAMAYLGKESYYKAFYILEDCRKKGLVFHVPYILSLLATRQYTRAKDFSEMYTLSSLSSPVRSVIQALVEFDPKDPATLEVCKRVTKTPTPQLHISQPVIEKIVEQYKMELFFQDPSALQTLQNDIITATTVLSKNERYFQSPRLQWLRKYLMQIFELIPLIVWVDGMNILLSSVQDRHIHEVFNKIEWLSKDNKHRLRYDDVERFFYEILLPTSVQQTMIHNGYAQYTVFEDQKLELGFVITVVEERGRSITLRILSMDDIKELKKVLLPILSIQRDAPTNIRATFDRIIFEWMEHRRNKVYWKQTVIPLIEIIPKEYQVYLEELKY